MKRIILAVAALAAFTACTNNKESEAEMVESVTEVVWGKTPDGQEAKLFTLVNANGMEVKISNYGGKIISWTAPDKDGNFVNINAGLKTIEEYYGGANYFGALIGRFGNRIGGAKFTLDGTEYTLDQNNGPNSLHGGKMGFDKLLWSGEIVEAENPTLKLTLTSPDGDGGYPGTVNVTVHYTLMPDNALKIDYEATTDKATPINLTNHAYFNLKGSGQDIMDHEVTIFADTFLPVDATLIPEGAPAPVAGTPFDFTSAHKIGERINDTTNTQIVRGGGYDHAWIFTDSSSTMKLGATVYEPTSGRFMEVFTTEPAIQFYSGNFLDGTFTSIEGNKFAKRSAYCLETEHYPDAPNKPSYPSTILRPGETYKTTTMYKLSVK